MNCWEIDNGTILLNTSDGQRYKPTASELYVQSQSGAIGGCHFDDGVHTVDKEEERKQIQENVLFLLHVPQAG